MIQEGEDQTIGDQLAFYLDYKYHLPITLTIAAVQRLISRPIIPKVENVNLRTSCQYEEYICYEKGAIYKLAEARWDFLHTIVLSKHNSTKNLEMFKTYMRDVKS